MEYLQLCCFQNAPASVVLDAYKKRLGLWSTGAKGRNYTEARNTRILDDIRSYYNMKSGNMDFLVGNWPCCETCYCHSNRVNFKLYDEIKKSWLESGRTLRVVETKHKKTERLAFKLTCAEHFWDCQAEVPNTFVFSDP